MIYLCINCGFALEMEDLEKLPTNGNEAIGYCPECDNLKVFVPEGD